MEAELLKLQSLCSDSALREISEDMVTGEISEELVTGELATLRAENAKLRYRCNILSRVDSLLVYYPASTVCSILSSYSNCV